MSDGLAAFVVGEGNWLPLAMGTALIAAGRLYFSSPARTVTRRRRILAVMNLFTGVMLLVMGSGHLLAVSTKLLQGTLRGSALIFYPIGLAIVAPAWLITRHTPRILSADDTRTTVRLQMWMAITLGGLHHRLRAAQTALGGMGDRDHRHRGRRGTVRRRTDLHGERPDVRGIQRHSVERSATPGTHLTLHCKEL
jgi:hypothetical protein